MNKFDKALATYWQGRDLAQFSINQVCFLSALVRHNRNVARAAREAQVSRTTAYRWLHKPAIQATYRDIHFIKQAQPTR